MAFVVLPTSLCLCRDLDRSTISSSYLLRVNLREATSSLSTSALVLDSATRTLAARSLFSPRTSSSLATSWNFSSSKDL